MEENSDCSLTKAVQDINQHGHTQSEVLKENEKFLVKLQQILSDVEKRGNEAELELKSKVRESLMLEENMEQLERQTYLLQVRCTSISVDITNLRLRVNEEEEKACTALAGYEVYQKKMEGHRAAVLHALRQTEAHKELEEKKARVRIMTQKKQELMEDLENPNGNTLSVEKGEIDAVKEQIDILKTAVAEKRAKLQEEFDTQTQLKKDIEIQNRRYEAIIKRLHCQRSKAQAVHRQMSADIYHMERQITELKRQLESWQDSVDSGN
ncbi:coiled-coil domain-containing protein 122-like [Thalassophryne amazonica]|uniref:coiled-coil domain-containing protein 122-like n=1 Tax=Thalassophryne amazonica TaxID=390379 RepID=UPI0014711C2B|nr:coiled-coil domain-containing protein 122-like [Thalassophryne amazonica]